MRVSASFGVLNVTQVRSLTCIAKDATILLGLYFLRLNNGDTTCPEADEEQTEVCIVKCQSP